MFGFIDTFLPVLRNCIAEQTAGGDAFLQTDWKLWRDCYKGGTAFRDTYLEKFAGKEDPADFTRRLKMTPIPAYAKREVRGIVNAIAQRLPDVIRRDGSKTWQESVRGVGRGIDAKGASMNSFLTRRMLVDLLVMGSVGCMVNAPKLPDLGRPLSKADIPKDFRPYLTPYSVEDTPILIEADSDSPSDWKYVLVRSFDHEFNLLTGHTDCKPSWQFFWLDDERGGLVSKLELDREGSPTGDPQETLLDAIPFVSYDIGDSIIAEACSYQITYLNMISADSSYAIDANYTTLVRQRSKGGAGSHLRGGKGDDTVRAGSLKGIYYTDKSPSYIAPPTGPMKLSLELRREMKKEIHDLVIGSVADIGEEGTIESGLASIGAELESGEQRCWDHYVKFENQPQSNKPPTVNYPDTWTLKTTKERIEDASAMVALGSVIVGQLAKKQAAKDAVDILHRGSKSIQDIDAMKAEIDEAPYAISDPKTVLQAASSGVWSVETAARAIGANEGEGEKALEDAAKRAQMVVAAQSEVNSATRGNEDGQAGVGSEKLTREGEINGDASLKKPAAPGRPENTDQK